MSTSDLLFLLRCFTRLSICRPSYLSPWLFGLVADRSWRRFRCGRLPVTNHFTPSVLNTSLSLSTVCHHILVRWYQILISILCVCTCIKFSGYRVSDPRQRVSGPPSFTGFLFSKLRIDTNLTSRPQSHNSKICSYSSHDQTRYNFRLRFPFLVILTRTEINFKISKQVGSQKP